MRAIAGQLDGWDIDPRAADALPYMTSISARKRNEMRFAGFGDDDHHLGCCIGGEDQGIFWRETAARPFICWLRLALVLEARLASLAFS